LARPALASEEPDSDEWGDDEDALSDDGFELEVRARRPASPFGLVAQELDVADRARPSPAEALERVDGVTLSRSGGPLAPAEPRLRGLGGARLRVDLDGLVLNDPVTGGVDAAALPLLSLARVERRPGDFGGALSLALPDRPASRLAVGVGTLETLRLAGAFALPSDDGGQLAGAATVARSDGRFTFQPSSNTGSLDDAPLATRENNDQQRAGAWVRASVGTSPWRGEGLAWGSMHEGGIPGFASSPTDGLRGRALTGAGRGALVLDAGDIEARGEVIGRASSRASWDRRRTSADAVTATHLAARLSTLVDELVGGLTLSASAFAARSEVLAPRFSRGTFGTEAAASWRFGDGAWRLDGGLGFATASDIPGPLPRARLGLETRGPAGMSAGLLLSHASRAPTLDELFAPRGFVLGNPDLRPEHTSDVESWWAWSPGRVVDARLSVFAGRLGDAILYVNRNAFEVAPANTGAGWRAGLDGRLGVTPHRLLGLELVAAALLSHLEATGAPLPGAPPLSARLRGRFGPAGGAHIDAQLRHRGSTTANLHGTLEVPAYSLLDLVAVFPVSERLRLMSAITNALDVLDARDANLLPLPGRQIFVSLEVRT
jgi:hypothetical protein